MTTGQWSEALGRLSPTPGNRVPAKRVARVGMPRRSITGTAPGFLRASELERSYCQKLCMGLSCGGAILAFSIHEFDASNDLGELI